MKSKAFISREGYAFCAVAVALCAVFALSVKMYDIIEIEANDGILASATDTVRDFLNRNEAVAVFLGFSDMEEDTEKAEAKDRDNVSAAAAEYIRRYNQIYESLE